MFKPLEIFIGLRYTRAKRRNHFISFISFASIAGITLGVMVIITVLSVMNGFENEWRTRILGVIAHGTVSSGYRGMENWEALIPELEKYPDIVGTAPFIHAEGMLSANGGVHGAMIRGILPEAEPAVSDFASKMEVGELDSLVAGEFGILLGQSLAQSMGLMVGDKVTVITPQASVTPVGVVPRLRRFTVQGIFSAGMYEYDSALALIHLDDAAKLFQMPNQITGVRYKLDDMFKAPLITQQLVHDLPRGFVVNDWTRQYANLFRALEIEQGMMFILLTLIVAVAAFNIVSTLIMVVTEKRADIAILRTLGISPRSVMVIFMVQGTIIGTFGAILGMIGGVILAPNVDIIITMVENTFGITILSAEIYQISDFPSDLHWDDVFKSGGVAFLLGVLSTIYPAWRASRTQPAEALRYE